MPILKDYRLFISHAWDYNDEYYRMVDRFGDANNFSWNNYSVPGHDPLNTRSNRELREKLDEQIRQVHVFIVLSGMYAAHRQWIQEEIDIAVSYNKPIIGVRPWGNTITPTAVTNVANVMHGWNIHPIIQSIRDLG